MPGSDSTIKKVCQLQPVEKHPDCYFNKMFVTHYMKMSCGSYCAPFCCSGVHHKGKNCNPQVKKAQVENQINQNLKHLFPNVVSVNGQSRFKLRDPKPNGGWGDIRDRNLCLSFLDGA